MMVEGVGVDQRPYHSEPPSDASSSLALGIKQILSASFGLKRPIVSSESLLCLGKEELPCSSVRLGLAYQVAKVVWDLVEVDGRCCWGFCGLELLDSLVDGLAYSFGRGLVTLGF